MQVLLAQINPVVGDLKGNTKKILDGISHAREKGAKLILFPELAVVGYPPEDFLLLPHFIKDAEDVLDLIIKASHGIAVVVGTIRQNFASGEKQLYNSAAVIENGVLLGFQDKTLLPTYDVFDERRFFEPATCSKIWKIAGNQVAITICEDIWEHSPLKNKKYQVDPVEAISQLQPTLVLNLSASPFNLNKSLERLEVVKCAAKTLKCPILLCNQVGGNDSLIFDGRSLYVDAAGQLLACAKGFQEELLLIDLAKSLKPQTVTFIPEEDLYHALILGIRDYFHKSNFKQACLGLSGGIDSAVVACLAAEALGKEHVLGILMPSRYSSEGSVSDALQLAKNLTIKTHQISIEGPFESYLTLLNPYFKDHPADLTEENMQARIRGMLLMAFSNKFGYIVLSTGNKSELAMGYSTLYGDMCGGLCVLSDVTKQFVYLLARYINRSAEIIPWNSIEKPPSAELRPNQKDSDSLPDYAIIDHVIKDYLEDYLSPQEIAHKHNYSLELVKDLIRRIHLNEYKRRQSPTGLRVSTKAFNVGRRFPIVQGYVK